MKKAAIGGVALGVMVFCAGWTAVVQSRTSDTRLASGCREDQITVQVFPEGHAWATRRSWLVLDNQGPETATVYYRSAAFIQKSLLTTVPPYGRVDLPVSELVWTPSAFSLSVWSSTGAVVAALVSWEDGFTAPFSSPMVLVCRGDVP